MRKFLLCSAALILLATPALAGWEWGGRDRGDRGGAGGRQTEREAYEQLRRDFPGQSTHSIRGGASAARNEAEKAKGGLGARQ